MQKIILKYGLLSGLCSAGLMLVTAFWFHQSGIVEGGEIVGYVGMLLSLIWVFVGVKAYRDQSPGAFPFAQALKVGGLMALISCICYVVGWMLTYEFVMPDFLEKYVAFTLENMKNSGASEQKIQEATAEMAYYQDLYRNPLYRAGLTFLEPLPMGVLATVVSAAVLRRK